MLPGGPAGELFFTREKRNIKAAGMRAGDGAAEERAAK